MTATCHSTGKVNKTVTVSWILHTSLKGFLFKKWSIWLNLSICLHVFFQHDSHWSQVFACIYMKILNLSPFNVSSGIHARSSSHTLWLHGASAHVTAQNRGRKCLGSLGVVQRQGGLHRTSKSCTGHLHFDSSIEVLMSLWLMSIFNRDHFHRLITKIPCF